MSLRLLRSLSRPCMAIPALSNQSASARLVYPFLGSRHHFSSQYGGGGWSKTRTETSKPANRRYEGREIAELVPNDGLINLIDRKGSFTRGVSLTRSLGGLREGERLVVVRIEGGADDEDPTVHCKVISNKPRPRQPVPGAEEEETKSVDKSAKPQKKKQQKMKTVVLGWTIAPNDLYMQKKSSIHSWFEKGHPIQITLGKQVKRQQRSVNSSLDLEKRKILLKACRNLCEEAGAIEQNTEGTVNSDTLILTYAPPTQPKQEEPSDAPQQ